MVALPQWEEKTGMDASMFEQGVFSDEGLYQGGRMKMVGLLSNWKEDDLGSPLFEGKHGLMQCAVNRQTGEYMTDASGKAICWYVPVVAGSHFTKGGRGAWLDSDGDIVHYQAISTVGIALLIAMMIIPMALLFIYKKEEREKEKEKYIDVKAVDLDDNEEEF